MPSAHSGAARSGARAQAIERSGARVRRAAADACLDQLDEGPREEPHIVVLAASPGGRERLGVAAVRVVQQGGHPPVDAQRNALASLRHADRQLLDQLEPFGFVAPPRGQHHRPYFTGAMSIATVMASTSSISAAAGPNAPP
jgi:hypothetical protein